MKVAVLLEQRRANWSELEKLCAEVASLGRSALQPERITRFATLYRAACADLALADAYQLPPSTIRYLHQLVGRAHNQLYRSRRFDIGAWTRTLLVDVPQQLFRDRCVQLVFLLFWGTFLGSAAMAYFNSNWASQVMPASMIERLEEDFKQPLGARPPEANVAMAGVYIWNNTGIGLRCFAWGVLIVPGLFITVQNALAIGAAFGYMGSPGIVEGTHFFEFVTAHGPFELTAIVVSAGAGLRLGLGWVHTHGLTRIKSLQQTARETMPIMGAAMVLFFLAALIEGFISPTSLPYAFKASVAILSSGMLLIYFVVLGFPRRRN